MESKSNACKGATGGGPKIHLAPAAMAARKRTKPRSHASHRLPRGSGMKVPGQDATRRTCPLHCLERTRVVAEEITIRQGVAETVPFPCRQGETETAHTLRHLRLGGRR